MTGQYRVLIHGMPSSPPRSPHFPSFANHALTALARHEQTAAPPPHESLAIESASVFLALGKDNHVEHNNHEENHRTENREPKWL